MAGLQLIPSHILCDIACLIVALLVTMSDTDVVEWAFLAVLGIRVVTAGPTSRWPITFFLVPVLILQATRRLGKLDYVVYEIFVKVFSLLGIAAAALFSVLFPPVQLPKIQGTFHVGIQYTFIPVKNNPKNDKDSSHPTDGDLLPENHQVAVKVLYPTLETPQRIPYLQPATANEYCRATMRFGAPPVLKNMAWMMQYLRLIHVYAKPQATLAPSTKHYPVVVYSHGLGGNADTYTYQSMKLASQGYIVVMVTHSDGSAVVCPTVSGSSIPYNFDLIQLWNHDKTVEYVRARRQQASHRAAEMIAVAEHLDYLHLPVDHKRVYFMGHSFGGTTSLTAAKRRPDLVACVIAHEPAMDWLPDDARHSFFHPDRLHGLDHDYNKGTGGYEHNHDDTDDAMHETNMLVLFSWEWREKGWAWSDTIEKLHHHQRIGPQGGVSEVDVVEDACHGEFSDMCMLTPLWLGRSVGLTGPRNPCDTASEIHERTLAFLRNFEEHHPHSD